MKSISKEHLCKTVSALMIFLIAGLSSCAAKPVFEEAARFPNQATIKKNVCDKSSDKLTVDGKVFFADKEYTLKALTASEAVISNAEGLRKVQPLQLYFGSGANGCLRAYKGNLTSGSSVYFNDKEYTLKAFDYKYGGAVLSGGGELRTVDINHIQFNIEEETDRACSQANDKLVVGSKVYFSDKQYTLKTLTKTSAIINDGSENRTVQPLQLYFGYGVDKCLRTYKGAVTAGSTVYFNDQEYKVKAFDYQYGGAVIGRGGELRTVDINHISY